MRSKVQSECKSVKKMNKIFNRMRPVPFVKHSLWTMKAQMKILKQKNRTEAKNMLFIQGIKPICDKKAEYEYRVAIIDVKNKLTKIGNMNRLYQKFPIAVFKHLKKMIVYQFLQKYIGESDQLFFFKMF